MHGPTCKLQAAAAVPGSIFRPAAAQLGDLARQAAPKAPRTVGRLVPAVEAAVQHPAKLLRPECFASEDEGHAQVMRMLRRTYKL